MPKRGDVMDRKTFDTVAILTALVLLPMIFATGWAYHSGAITFREYLEMWRDPALLLIGFWARGGRAE